MVSPPRISVSKTQLSSMGRPEDVQVIVAYDGDDWLSGTCCARPAPPPSKPSRLRREIGIDDCLQQRKREQNVRKRRDRQGEGKGKGKGKKGKNTKFSESMIASGSSDDSDSQDDKFLEVARVVEECKQKVLVGGHEASGADTSKWGRRLFGSCKEIPNPPCVVVGDGVLGRLQKFLPVMDPVQLLSGNQLLTAAALSGNLDESTARWAFHHMSFSQDQRVEESACEMLCKFATCAPEPQPSVCSLVSGTVCGWGPRGELFLSAFRCLGYVEDRDARVEGVDANPRNLSSLLTFLAACSRAPAFAKFSVEETERLLVLLIEFIADQHLQEFLHLVFDCLEALVDYLEEEDWSKALQNIVSPLAGLFFANLLFVKAYFPSHKRLGELQNRLVSLQLSRYANRDICSAADVVLIFKPVSFKKLISFVELYHQLVFADVFLWRFSPFGPEDVAARRTWLSFLHKCSSQINCSDARLCATKVRNWASFLCQKYASAVTGMPISRLEEDCL